MCLSLFFNDWRLLMKNTVLDPAIKFGAGRYLQHPGALSCVGPEAARHGNHVFVLSDHNAWKAAGEKIEESLKQAGVTYEVELYEGTCSDETARRLASSCQEKGMQEVIGVGGGVIMDLAKAAAFAADLGVINVPTSIATCAAFSTMSIMYTPDGKTEESRRFEKEADGIIVDTDVIVHGPARYAAAGILDAMAKRIEISNGHTSLSPDTCTYDFYTAYAMSQYTYDLLWKYGPKAVKDIEEHRLSNEVEYVTFINIAVTGLLSNMTRNYNQSALAHMLYYAARTCFTKETKPYLHGEIVSAGLFLQLHFNHMDAEEEKLRNYAEAMHMPLTLKEIGIPPTEENLSVLYAYLSDSRFVSKENRDLLKESLQAIA
jgi:glycerol dehydrogenase-like iron-containing ADH family enzyme